jgi:hypothetical protein
MSGGSFKEQAKFISTIDGVEKTRLLRVQIKRVQALDAKREADQKSQLAVQEHSSEQVKLLSTQEAIVQLTQCGLDLILFGASCNKRSAALESIAKSHAQSLEAIKTASKEVQDCLTFELRSLEKLAALSKLHRFNAFAAEATGAELEQEDLIPTPRRAQHHG